MTKLSECIAGMQENAEAVDEYWMEATIAKTEYHHILAILRGVEELRARPVRMRYDDGADHYLREDIPAVLLEDER